MPALPARPHFLDGRPWPAGSSCGGLVFDPARGEPIARVPFAGRAEVDAAVGSAAAAQAPWGEAPLGRRAEIMFAFRQHVLGHSDELAALVTTEQGKTLADARGEIARGIEVLEYACGMPKLLQGAHSSQLATGVDAHSLLQPLGVVAAITPFNFPVMVPLWTLAGAIACGNAVVLKPSEKTPGAALRLAALATAAGVPPGVLNVIHGDHTTAGLLLAHPGIDAVSFVGSTPAARQVHERATAAGKRVQALGGAKNHMVVLPDADLNMAADAAVSAGFGAAGERCMAISVLVAVGAVADRLVEAVAQRIPAIRIGAGSDPDVDMGPLISAAHRERVLGYVGRAAAQGARLVSDGRMRIPAQGFFVGPTLIDHVTPAMDLYRDEIFGPVLSVVRVPSFDAALELVNSHACGNGAALFTRDGGAARRFEREVQAGMVGINVPIPVPAAQFSFGGWKSSLYGDLHIYGPDGIRFLTRTKVVTTRWPAAAPGRLDLGFPTQR